MATQQDQLAATEWIPKRNGSKSAANFRHAAPGSRKAIGQLALSLRTRSHSEPTRVVPPPMAAPCTAAMQRFSKLMSA